MLYTKKVSFNSYKVKYMNLSSESEYPTVPACFKQMFINVFFQYITIDKTFSGKGYVHIM